MSRLRNSDTAIVNLGGTDSVSRRGVLIGGAAAAGAAMLAACSSSKKSVNAQTGTTAAGSPPSTSSSTTASGGGSGDAKVAMTAASLEVLAVGTYKSALDAATAANWAPCPRRWRPSFRPP
jgi:hypothetical protein